jgi:hypothetical protein
MSSLRAAMTMISKSLKWPLELSCRETPGRKDVHVHVHLPHSQHPASRRRTSSIADGSHVNLMAHIMGELPAEGLHLPATRAVSRRDDDDRTSETAFQLKQICRD